MGDSSAHLRLKLDTAEPVELADFVGAFTSLANEFERYVDDEFPGARADTRIYVREVRSGCIEADLVGIMMSAAATTIQNMDQVLVLEDFVKRWGRRLTSLITNQIAPDELASVAQLNDFYKATQSIACDPIAAHRLEAAVYEDGKREVRAAFTFTSSEARTAQQNIEDRKKALSKPQSNEHSRVLMRYTRTDVHDASINKKSGERVLISAVSPKDLPVIYASEMVEQEMREAIREADENVYKRGFVVDVAAQTVGERVGAYSITKLHSIIDLSAA